MQVDFRVNQDDIWRQGVVSVAMDEMIKCHVQDNGKKSAGTWLATDGDNLALMYQYTQNDRE